MNKFTIITLILLPFLAACSHSPVPNSKTYVKSEQQLMQTAHHWNLYAQLEAEKIAATIPEDEIIFIEIQDKTSPFEKALYHLLTSQLLSKRAMLVIDPEISSMTLKYHVQIISRNKQGIATVDLSDIGDGFQGRQGTEQKVEVLITTQGLKNSQIIISDSQIYYFYPDNTKNYEKPKPLATFEVTDIR